MELAVVVAVTLLFPPILIFGFFIVNPRELIDARKMIVEGAVSIVRDAISQLKDCGIEVSTPQREALISNMLVVLCSGEQAQPVLSVQSGQKA